MKYCPECECEFIEERNLCPDCDVALVSEGCWRDMASDKDALAKKVFRPVKIVENQFEADVVSDVLEKENIPVLIRSYMDTAYDGIFLPQKGWGTVNVPEDDVETAMKIIDEAL